MHTASGIALILLAAVVVSSILWRLLSRRHSLPCPFWLGRMVESDNPFASSNRASFIVERLRIKPRMRILDAGCGPGRVTLPLAMAASSAGIVVAADLQQGMLDRVIEKARSSGLVNVSTVKTGLGEGRLANGAFDRAVICAVLGEIPDRSKVMTELFECLKPGGLLAVAELIFDPHFQSAASVRKLAGAVGFVEREMHGNRFAYLLILERPQ